MKNRIKTILGLFAVYLVSCFLIASLSFGQEMPKPGTVIDKSNYKTYAHLFPAEILPAFEDGFGGLIKPASITVGEPKHLSYTMPKTFLTTSEENKGKFSLSADGKIQGGWQRQGLPFPDLQMGDKDFATKFMWNYAGRYMLDDIDYDAYSYIQRKGEPVRWNVAQFFWLYFTNRAVIPPKPVMKNENNLANLAFIHYKEPSSLKNMMTLSLRYMDVNKADEVYIYLPNLRRVLRGDTGQRAVPLQGNIASLDDLNSFDGKTDEFTYKFVGEQKMLVITESEQKDIVGHKIEKIPFMAGPYTPADVYVIDIFSKNPTYPQSRKRIWVDKNHLGIYCCVVWDRAGKLWKFWSGGYKPLPIPGDKPFLRVAAAASADLQFGMANLMEFTNQSKFNQGGVSWEDFSQAAMLKKAR